jgi:hypothetical protein
VYFSLEEFDDKLFESLSDGYKKLIAASPEYQSLKDGTAKTGSKFDDMADDIPF